MSAESHKGNRTTRALSAMSRELYALADQALAAASEPAETAAALLDNSAACKRCKKNKPAAVVYAREAKAPWALCWECLSPWAEYVRGREND